MTDLCTDIYYPVSWNTALPPEVANHHVVVTTRNGKPIRCTDCTSAITPPPPIERNDNLENVFCVDCCKRRLGIPRYEDDTRAASRFPLDILTRIALYSRTWRDLVNFCVTCRFWCTAVNRDVGEETDIMVVKRALLEREIDRVLRFGTSDVFTRLEEFIQRLRMNAVRVKWSFDEAVVAPAVVDEKRSKLLRELVHERSMSALYSYKISPTSCISVAVEEKQYVVVQFLDESSKSIPQTFRFYFERETGELVCYERRTSPGQLCLAYLRRIKNVLTEQLLRLK
eukprot:PhM_4_TR13334/c0_g3_i1/m.17466